MSNHIHKFAKHFHCFRVETFQAKRHTRTPSDTTTHNTCHLRTLGNKSRTTAVTRHDATAFRLSVADGKRWCSLDPHSFRCLATGISRTMFRFISHLVSAKITKKVKTVLWAQQQSHVCPTTASTARNVTGSSRPSAQIVSHAAIQEMCPVCWYLVLGTRN